MVIKRGKDGKYYIAPSPPSFYKSPTPKPKSRGGSSSSPAPNPFLDMLDKSQAEADAKLKIIAPNYTPTSRGGSSSSSSNNTANIQNIAAIANAEKLRNSIDQGNAASAALNINQQSTVASGFISTARANADRKASQSYNPVSSKQIADAGYRGDISPSVTMTAQTKVLRDKIRTTAEREIKDYADNIGQQNKKSYDEYLALEERRLNNVYKEIQNRINNGGDYNKLSKEFELNKKKADERLKAKALNLDSSAELKLKGFAKEWEDTRGKSIEREAGLILRSTDRLVRISPTQLKNKFIGAFIGGVGVGAGATGIIQATGLTISKGVGIGLTAGAAGLSIGAGFATAGYDVARGRLKKDEYLEEAGTRGVVGGVSFLGGFSGAVVGSVAATTASNLIRTGNLKGIKPIERELAKQAYEKNGLTAREIKGTITEGSIKKLSIDTQAKQTLLKEVKTGNIIRKTTYTPNTKGLNAAEVKALAKYNLKIETYSVYNRAGNVIKTFEISRITGKAPITRINKGADEVYSYGQGQLKAGKSTLNRVSITNKAQPIRDRLSALGQQRGRISEISLEQVRGTGATAKAGGYRLEVGAGKSTSLFRFNPQAKTFDITPKTSAGRSTILSKQTGTNIGVLRSNQGSLFSSKTNTYGDLFGTGSVKGAPTSLNLNPSSSLGGSGGSSGGGSLGGLKLTTVKGGSLLGLNVVSGAAKSSGLGIITTTPTTTAGAVIAPPKLFSGTKNLFSPLSINNPKLDNRNIPITNQKSLLFQSLSPQKQTSFLGSNIRGASAQRITQIKTPTSRQSPPSLFSATPSPLKTPSNLQSLGGSGLFGGLGFLGAVSRVKTGGGGIGRKEKGGIFGKTRYSASLGSILTGYSKKGNAQSLSKQTFSGIGLRPLLEKPDKKKKKKKKK